MPRSQPQDKDAPEPVTVITVRLTARERQQMKRASWVITSLGEPGEINAMDSAIRKLKQAVRDAG